MSRDVIFVEDDFSENVKIKSLSDHFGQESYKEESETPKMPDRTHPKESDYPVQDSTKPTSGDFVFNILRRWKPGFFNPSEARLITSNSTCAQHDDKVSGRCPTAKTQICSLAIGSVTASKHYDGKGITWIESGDEQRIRCVMAKWHMGACFPNSTTQRSEL